MGATNNIMTIDNGVGSISSYNAGSDAANTYLPLSKDHVALSTDLKEMRPKRQIVISDFIAGAATGVVQIEIDGSPHPAGGFINYAAHQASIATRPRLNIVIPAGSTFRIKVVSALAA